MAISVTSRSTSGVERLGTDVPAALLEALERALGAERVLLIPKGSKPPEPTKSKWGRRQTHMLAVDVPGLQPARQVVWELPEPPTKTDRAIAASLARSLAPQQGRVESRASRGDARGLLRAMGAPENERPAALLTAVCQLLGARSGGLAVAGTEPKTYTEGPGRPVLRRAALMALDGEGPRVEVLERSFIIRQLVHDGEVVGGVALEGVGASADLDGSVEALSIILGPPKPPTTEARSGGPERGELLAAVLAAFPVPAVAVDPDGLLLAATPEAQTLFELTDFDVGVSMQGRLGGVSVARVAEGAELPNELSVRGRRVEPIVAALPGGGWFFLFRDRSAEDEMQEAREDLMAAMAHELRTPVAVVKALLGVLKHPAMREDSDRLEGLVADGAKEISRLERLVEDLLLCARVATGGITAHAEDIEIRPVVDEVTRRVQKRFTEINVDVRGDGAARADAGLTRHAVWHLLDNAAKFGPSDGSVTVDVASSSEGTTVEVTDRGEGIFSGDVEHVFEAFHRADKGETQHRGGAGVGLYLVKAVIEAQGGDVWVRSRLGKGSTFGFRLPPPRG